MSHSMQPGGGIFGTLVTTKDDTAVQCVVVNTVVSQQSCGLT